MYLIMKCDDINTEVDKILATCQDMRDSNDEEISEFIEYISNHRIVITAADLFEINRKTFLTIFGIASYFLAAILQFYKISFQTVK